MKITEQAQIYIQSTPLARIILSEMARSELDVFKISDKNSAINKDHEKEYVFVDAQSLGEVYAKMKKLTELGIIKEVLHMPGTPGKYYFRSEISISKPPAKRNPKFRDELAIMLGHTDSSVNIKERGNAMDSNN
jgi:hypothetical protein